MGDDLDAEMVRHRTNYILIIPCKKCVSESEDLIKELEEEISSLKLDIEEMKKEDY